MTSNNEVLDVNQMADTGYTEDVPDITGFADEPGGAWKGWFKAEIVAGYTTGKGKVFQTEDTVSRDGNSRNLRLCLSITNGNQTRTNFTSFNYRVGDFDKDRLCAIEQARKAFAAVNKWPDSSLQRSSLAIAKLGQMFKATGVKPKRREDGVLIPDVFVGAKADVYLAINDKGFNDITQFAAPGAKTK